MILHTVRLWRIQHVCVYRGIKLFAIHRVRIAPGRSNRAAHGVGWCRTTRDGIERCVIGCCLRCRGVARRVEQEYAVSKKMSRSVAKPCFMRLLIQHAVLITYIRCTSTARSVLSNWTGCKKSIHGVFIVCLKCNESQLRSCAGC